jgi:hypothetical protein
METPEALPPGMKKCVRCELPKLITDFYLATKTGQRPGTPRRRMHWCKECHKKYSTQRRAARLKAEGQAYRDRENQRVRTYMNQEVAADNRRASERAKQAALRELRERHSGEYATLLREARAREGLHT